MKEFAGKLAVITGAGTGMGRELAIQLASEGCHLAICDVSVEEMSKTAATCLKIAPGDIRVSSHECDVSNEADVLAFRDGVLKEHATDHINLLFNNAGISGGGSFLNDSREDWERAQRSETNRVAVGLQDGHRVAVREIATALEALSRAVAGEREIHDELRRLAPMPESPNLPNMHGDLLDAAVSEWGSTAWRWARRLQKLKILG